MQTLVPAAGRAAGRWWRAGSGLAQQPGVGRRQALKQPGRRRGRVAGKGQQGAIVLVEVDKVGNVFATAPGGVLILAPDGTHLGTIQTGEATANCNWGNDGSVLYITADMFLCRVRTTTRGKGW